MRVAILGPIVKDNITVDDDTHIHIGGIPYYAGQAFMNLGIDVTAFVTYAKEDDEWMREHMSGVPVEHIPVEKTLEFSRIYNRSNPDKCLSATIRYTPNTFQITDELLDKLSSYDYIILSPLLHDNIPQDLFSTIKNTLGIPIIHGNFGMFTYSVDGDLTHKHPENLRNVAPFIDYLFLDENEITFVAEKDNVEDAVKVFLELGTKTIVVTNGSQGSRIFEEDSVHEIDAYEPTIVTDPTGAGDTYLAAFVCALSFLNKREHQGKFAAMAATHSIEKRGAFKGNREDIIKLLEINDEHFTQ